MKKIYKLEKLLISTNDEFLVNQSIKLKQINIIKKLSGLDFGMMTNIIYDGRILFKFKIHT